MLGGQLEPLATLLAAIAGALVAIVIMDGPLWLLAPGALGAAPPVVLSRLRTPRDE